MPAEGVYGLYLQVLGANGTLSVDGKPVSHTSSMIGARHGDTVQPGQDNLLPTTDYPATDPRYPERGLQASGEVTYSEGIDVGYRWFERQGTTPLYPFGYGLAYTRFEYSRLSVDRAGDGGLDVKFEVRNTGRVESDEVPQVYLGAPTTPPQDGLFAVRALAGFDRIHLRPGEQRSVLIHVRPRSLQYWDEQSVSWKRPDGTRDLFVGPSSADLPLRQQVR